MTSRLVLLPVERWSTRWSAYDSTVSRALVPPGLSSSRSATEPRPPLAGSNADRTWAMLGPSVPATSPASSVTSRISMVCGSCSNEKKSTDRPSSAMFRAAWSAQVVLPSPCGPARRTSSPERTPPPRWRSRGSKPVGQTRAAAWAPPRSLLLASSRTSVRDWRAYSTQTWKQSASRVVPVSRLFGGAHGQRDFAYDGRSPKVLGETRDRRLSVCPDPAGSERPAEGPAKRAACAGDTESDD